MKKRYIFIASSLTLLSIFGVINTQNKKDVSEFSYNTLLNNNEIIGKRNKAVQVEDIEHSFAKGESEYVSPVLAQVIKNETSYSIRFVAALKGNLTENNISVDGYAGFHIKYTKANGIVIDKHLKVENYYLSMNAGGIWYYANELSSHYEEENAKSMDDFLSIKGFENKNYNLFISLDIQGIDETNLNTLIDVQPYFVNSNGVRSYSEFYKSTSSVGYESKFVEVNGVRNELTKDGETYKIENLSLKAGDKISIVDSYGQSITDFGEEKLIDGYYIVPRDGNYYFSLTGSKVNVIKPLEKCIVTFDKNELSVREDNEISLPTYKVVDLEGVNQTEYINVEIKDLTDDKILLDEKYHSQNIGNHQIQYTFKEPNTNKVVAQEVININVYKRIIAKYTDGIKLINEESNPSFTASNTGNSGLSFYFEPSKNYYAEFDISSFSNYQKDQLIAMSHNISEDGIPTKGVYYTGMQIAGENNFNVATSRYVDTWSTAATLMWDGSKSSLNGREQTPNIDLTKTNKMAIARIDDTFYYFYNDKLFSMNKFKELANVNTYPGLTFRGAGVAIGTTFSNFNFIKTVDEVKTKVDSLITSNFDYFTNYGNTKSQNWVTFNKNSFSWTGNIVTNQSQNNSMVTPLATLWGEWEVSFDLKADLLGDNNNWGDFKFDIRTYQDKKNVVSFNTVVKPNNIGYKQLEMFESELGGSTITDSSLINAWKNAFGGLIDRDSTLHFVIKEKINDGSETFTFTISDKNDASKTYSFDYTINYSNKSYVGGPKYIIFKALKFAGTISNFQFK